MLRLTLFGSPQLRVDDEAVNLHRDKAIALLAYLAMTGTIHRRDHLAELTEDDVFGLLHDLANLQSEQTLGGVVHDVGRGADAEDDPAGGRRVQPTGEGGKRPGR